MSTNFRHLRIKSNLYLKSNKHEKKLWRVLNSNLSNSGLLLKINKYEQKKRVSSNIEKMTIWWNFQFTYSGKLEFLCIKSAQKINKILAHKIHQAKTELFLRHRESECLCLLNSQETGKKVCLERIQQPKPKERKFIIMKLYKHRSNNIQIRVTGLRL